MRALLRRTLLFTTLIILASGVPAGEPARDESPTKLLALADSANHDGLAGWERRLEYARMLRGAPPDGDFEKAMADAREQRSRMEAADTRAGTAASSLQSVPGNAWSVIGPAPMKDFEQTNDVSGRVRAIAVDPGDPTGQTIYIGGAMGGVWKTVDGGGVWKPLTDSLESISIGDIKLDPQNSQIVYVGTGELGTAIDGAGVFRSADGGVSWIQQGRSSFGDRPSGGDYVAAIAFDPTPVADPLLHRTLHVATKQGIFRSTDSGQSWNPALTNCWGTDVIVDPVIPSTVYTACHASGIYRSETSGSPGSYVRLTDLNNELPLTWLQRVHLAAAAGTGGSTVLYASMQDRGRFSRELKGIWKSTDRGTRWSRVTGHPPQFKTGGMVGSPDVGETEPNDTRATADPVTPGDVAEGTLISSTDVDYYRIQPVGNVVNVEILAGRTGTGLDPRLVLYDKNGVKLKESGGNNAGDDDERITMGWDEVTPGENHYVKVEAANGTAGDYQISFLGMDLWCQCEYDQELTVDPGDPSVVYMGAVRLYRSEDGGVNWNQIQDHDGGYNWIHQDIHVIVPDPARPGRIYVGSDGGVFVSNDYGDNWAVLNTNLALTQPVYIAQHPTDPDFMLLGSQDNGVASYDGSDWTTVTGGDGSSCAIISDQEWYYATNNLWMVKTDDGGVSYKSPKSGWFKGLYRDRVMLYAQFVVHPVSTGHLIAGGGRSEPTGQKHYVYRSEDRGANWTANSQHLGGTIHKVAMAKTDLDVAYAGLSNGKVFGTTDRGATDWVEQTIPGRPNSLVNDLEVDPTDEDTVYVIYGGYGHAHIFRTTNGGTTWAAVGTWPPAGPTDLPDLPMYSIVVDPTYPDTLFVGTELGIYRSEDGGVTWKTYDHGLPNVLVRDLILSATTGPVGKLRAGTYGRGVWELGFGNDECDDAIPIGDGTEYGTTTAAGADGTASCGNSNSTPDVWYRYTSTCDGQLSVDTCGSSYDTVVSVHGSVCPGTSANEQACNDDCTGGPCGSGKSCVTVPTEIGDEHLIRVGGFHNNWGNFALTTACSVLNDGCEEATPLTVPASVPGSTRSAATDTAPVCGGITPNSAGVWYTVVGGGKLITASLCSGDTDYDSRLSVYCAGCGGQSCVGADDDACGVRSELTWCAAAGQTYHILVHGKLATGQFRLELSEGASCSLAVSCAPSNDLCENGTPVGNTFPGPVLGDNTGVLYPDDPASCATSIGDVYFDYVPPCQGWSTVDTCPALGDLADTVVSVLDSCGGDEIACNDDHADCSPRSKLTIPVQADRSYKVRVASYGSTPDPGVFPLSIGQTPAPLAVPPSGLYVADGAGSSEDHLFRLDLVERWIVDVGPNYEQGLAGMAYAPNLSTMYGVNDEIDTDDMVTVDLQTGEVLPFGPVGSSMVRALAWDPITLTLYGADAFDDELLEIDPYTGASTVVGSLGYSDVQGLAFDPTTGTLYGADDNTDKLIVIDPSTGAGSDVGWFGAGMDGIQGLTFDTDRNVLYGIRIEAGTSQIVRIDTATGRATAMGGSYFDVGSDALAFVPGLPYAIRERPYDERLPVGGGCPDYFFGNYSGLPEGIEGSLEGRISGIPADSGTYPVSFSVDDTNLDSPAVWGEYTLRVRPGNDDCDVRYPAGDGDTFFNTVNALTDGPDEPAQCLFSGDSQVGSDVWYCYRATCTGELDVNLCASDYDTKVAVYEGCACPSVESAVACNDDQCGTRSRLWMPVTAGNDYLIRVGGYDEARGEAIMGLACDGAPGGACCLPAGCFLLTAEQCAAQDGGYYGDWTNCGADADGDGRSDPCDGCPGDPNKFDPGVCGCGSVEHDSDGDGWFDCEDCDPGFANTHAGAPESNDGVDNQCPGESGHGLVDEITGIAGFFVPDSKNIFSWPAQAGASHYEVARAADREFTVDCALFEFVDPEWNDLDYPLPGNGFYYLVRAKYPHTGSWGTDSSGTERASICP